MDGTRIWLLEVNVAGGLAVLGSYAYGLATHPGAGSLLWGGLPASWRPLYGVSMLLAAAGYLAVANWTLLRIDLSTVRLAGGLDATWLLLPFLLILVPSALWMPLTWRFVDGGGEGWWLAIRVVLALVGVGAAVLLAMIAGARPRTAPLHHALAIAGAAAFLFHCGVLDALLWPARFRG